MWTPSPLAGTALVEFQVTRDAATMIDVTDIPGILRRHLIWMFVLPVVFVCLALVFLSLKTPEYQASTELLIQPKGVQILVNDPEAAASSQFAQGMDFDSQIYVILSESVLNKVADNLNLDQRLSKAGSGYYSAREVRASTLSTLRETVQVLRLDRSFVFKIRVRNQDPVLAADIANETARVYLDQSRSIRSDALNRASSSLGQQATELRARVEAAEAAVEAYRAEQGLISTAAGGLVVDQQLEDINSQITQARVGLEQARSANAQVTPLTLADVEAGALPQTVANSVLSSLRVQYAQIAQQEAQAATTLGANHPTLRELRSQLKNTGGQINAELQRIKKTVQAQYEQAQTTLVALQNELKSLQSQNSNQGEALIELRQLQSEADANREVYQAFLRRARELEELPEIDPNTSRILSEAQIPTSPNGPRKIIVLAAAGLFGLILAAAGSVGIAIVSGRLMSERSLVENTGISILAELPVSAPPSRFKVPFQFFRFSHDPRSRQELAFTRIAYALREGYVDCEAANILLLSLDGIGDTTAISRRICEELGAMGEPVLFAHTTTGHQSAPAVAGIGDRGGQHLLHAEGISRFAQAVRAIPQAGVNHFEPDERLEFGRGGGLSRFLKVEDLDTRRKYGAAQPLETSRDGFLIIDAGSTHSNAMLPVLLRHSDGILLVSSLGDIRLTDLDRTMAYLEPWQDRMIGNVVLKAA